MYERQSALSTNRKLTADTLYNSVGQDTGKAKMSFASDLARPCSSFGFWRVTQKLKLGALLDVLRNKRH